MKNTLKTMLVAVAMTVVLASCGAKTEKAASEMDTIVTETSAAIDTAASVVAPLIDTAKAAN